MHWLGSGRSPGEVTKMRDIPQRGQFMVGEAHPAEDPRRAKIEKGMFMTSTPVTSDAKPVRQFSQVEESSPSR